MPLCMGMISSPTTPNSLGRPTIEMGQYYLFFHSHFTDVNHRQLVLFFLFDQDDACLLLSILLLRFPDNTFI